MKETALRRYARWYADDKRPTHCATAVAGNIQSPAAVFQQ